MELAHLDTANVAEVERLARIYPLAGVTTNPSIIAAGKVPVWDVLPRLQKAVGPEGTLFAQTMSRDAQGMVEEAKRLSNAVPGIVVKIPVTAEGLAIKLLKKEGIPTLGTAVYSASQGLLAALAGASTSRLTLTASTPRAGTASAWCRSCNPAGNACAREQSSGGKLQNATPGAGLSAGWLRSNHLPLDVAQQMLGTPAVESAIEKFEQDWNTAFGTLNL